MRVRTLHALGFATLTLFIASCSRSQPALVAGGAEVSEPEPEASAPAGAEAEEEAIAWAPSWATDSSPAGGLSAEAFEPTGWSISAGPIATAAGTVFVGSSNGIVAALSLGSRVPTWETDFGSPVLMLASAPRSILAATSTALHALAVADGTVLWSASLRAPPAGPATTSGSGVYLSLERGTLVAFDIEDGSERWLSRAPGLPVGEMVLFDGRLIGVTTRGTAFGIETLGGEIEWELSLPGEYESGVALRGQELGSAEIGPALAAVSVSGEVTVFRPDGARGTQFLSEVEPVLERPVWVNGRILVPGADGTLALYADSGEQVWTLSLGDHLAGSPFAFGNLIVGWDSSGGVTSIESESGRLLSRTSVPGIRTGSSAFLDNALVTALRSGMIGRVLVDGPTQQPELLAGDESHVLPPSGTFRLQQDDVRLSLGTQRDAVFDIRVSASPAEDLVIQVVAADGTVVATNMGKVALAGTLRAALAAGISYELVITRPDPRGETIITIQTDEIL